MAGNKLEPHEIAADLIKLSGKSAKSFSDVRGIHRSNLYTWLKKGGRDVGIDAQDNLLSVLGFSGGTLSPDRIHFWTLKTGDLLPLARVLKWAGASEPFKIIYLAPEFSPKVFLDGFKTNPLLIHSFEPPIRIVFRYVLPVLLPVTQIQLPDPVLVQTGIAAWKMTSPPPKIKKGFPFIRVARDVFDQFLDGSIQPEGFDRVFESQSQSQSESEKTEEEKDSFSESEPDWKAVIFAMKKAGISPKEALNLIARMDEK